MSTRLAVRLFAAAREAAGTDTAAIELDEPMTLDEVLAVLVERYGGPDGALSGVVARCSFLLDGRQARRADPVAAAGQLDILPPFAGG